MITKKYEIEPTYFEGKRDLSIRIIFLCNELIIKLLIGKLRMPSGRGVCNQVYPNRLTNE